MERTDDVVRTRRGEKAFIKAGAEIPVIALVVFVAVKTPDTVDHDHRADAIVPEIAKEMETQISPRVGALESHVVVNNDLREPETTLREISTPWARRRGVIAQRPKFPLRVNDGAIIRRQLGLGCFTHKRLSLTRFDQTIRHWSSARFLLH